MFGVFFCLLLIELNFIEIRVMIKDMNTSKSIILYVAEERSHNRKENDKRPDFHFDFEPSDFKDYARTESKSYTMHCFPIPRLGMVWYDTYIFALCRRC